jgi:hypothetical protein
MNAHEIKALGAIWGHQSGLLSAGELDALMGLVAAKHIDWERRDPSVFAVLEVGHFMGLSTCGIVHALQGVSGWGGDFWGCDDWTITTVDAHIADAWVPETPTWVFEENMRTHFADPRLTVRFDLSQTLVAPLPFDFVFYDGDHAEEQERFTLAVLKSPRVRTFVFDDRDFPVPARCCEILREAGWVDESPAVVRAPGDKGGAETMTLGVFRRGAEP